jgi:hypothetical protein
MQEPTKISPVDDSQRLTLFFSLGFQRYWQHFVLLSGGRCGQLRLCTGILGGASLLCTLFLHLMIVAPSQEGRKIRNDDRGFNKTVPKSTTIQQQITCTSLRNHEDWPSLASVSLPSDCATVESLPFRPSSVQAHHSLVFSE